MCLNIPYRVIEIKGDKAVVKFNKRVKEVLIIDKKPKVGDYVILKNGVIIEILPQEFVENVLQELEKSINHK